jgi:hypothetical protein
MAKITMNEDALAHYEQRVLWRKLASWEKELSRELWVGTPAAMHEWALQMMNAFGPDVSTLDQIVTGFARALEKASEVQRKVKSGELK